MMMWADGKIRDSGVGCACLVGKRSGRPTGSTLSRGLAVGLMLGVTLWLVTGMFAPMGGLDRFGAAAADLERTTPGHMSPSRRGNTFKWRTEPFNKPQIDPFKAGVIWRAAGSFKENTRFEGGLSRACREGLFARVAGGFGDFGDVRVPAAPVAGVYNPTRLILRYPIYFFRYENTTRCQVYRPR
jgi:hypothetical protein